MSLAFDIPTKGFSTLEVLGVGAAKKHKSNKIAVALASLTKRETVSPCV
jgi:hypothetical protein